MARTALFRLLAHSCAVSRGARAAHAPADRHTSQRFGETAGPFARGLSRRQFLAVTGTAAAWPLAGCASLPLRSRKAPPQVVIVGAGLAGLTAAYRLRVAGVQALVLEAQDRVGGRCFTVRGHFPEGQLAEYGAELIDSRHLRLRGLADELEVPLDDVAELDAGLTRQIYLVDDRPYAETAVVEALAALAPRFDADLRSIRGADVTYRSPGDAAALDRMSVAEWLSSCDADRWVCRLLEVAAVTEFGLDAGDQSALNLLLRLTSADDRDRIARREGAFRVRGGSDRIARELASLVSVRSECVLEAMTERPDGLLELMVLERGRAWTIAAPHVILALPFTLLRSVKLDVELPPAKRAAIQQLGYGTGARLIAAFDRRVWRTKYKSNGSVLADSDYQSISEASRGQDGTGGILTSVTGGRQGLAMGTGAAGEQVLRMVGGLERTFTGLASTRWAGRDVRFHWPTHTWSKGSYAAYRPGQWTTIRGAEGERVRNLHFAGEHCSLRAQGCMEGAVETGEAAATAVLRDLGIEAPRRGAS